MLCIENGTLVTPQGLVRANLYIKDGKITAVGGSLPTDERYDASGCLLFPGFIDAHTHLQMEVGVTWTADDYASGTAAALAGGTTSILDFATQERGGSLQDALDTWQGRALGNCSCDYGFHMAVTD
jgi:dihydropyrimidinase